MPRIVSPSSALASRAKATAYPETRSDQPAAMSPEVMRSMLFKTPPKRDTYGRTRFGRNLNVDRIEKSLASAQYGLMRELTDLGRETIATDPHLAAVLNKRINAVSALPYDIIAAEGPGIDPKKAEANAELVRAQIARIPHFRQAIRQLAWALFDGRSALEIQWLTRPSAQRTASKVGSPYPEPELDWVAAELNWIHPRRLSFGPQRELRISDDSYAAGFMPIGIALRDYAFKFIEFKPQLFGDYPELEGICPRAVYWSFFKRFGQRDRMILLELFGKPWRVVTVDPDSTAGLTDLLDAEAAADELGGNATTARMPRGTKLETITVGKNAGEVHADVIVYSDAQISKLVLGQTGTTDAQNSGLGSNQPSVMAGEQLQILEGDAELVGDAFEDGLTDAIVALNRGVAELDHAPRFKLRTQVPGDPTAEAARLKAVLDSGLSVAAEQAYEVVGFRRPTDSDDTIVYEPVSLSDGTSEMRPVLKPALKPDETDDADDVDEIVKKADESFKDDAADKSAVPKFAIAPADLASVVTVNEARQNAGLPLLLNPDGSERPEGLMTLVEFKAKYSPAPFGGGPSTEPKTPALPGDKPPPPPGGPPAPPDSPPKPGAPPVPETEPAKPAPASAGETPSGAPVIPGPFKVKGEKTLEEFFEQAEALSAELEAVLAMQATGVAIAADEHHCRAHAVELAKQAQPDTVHGTLEDLIDRGVKEAAREFAKWTAKYESAVAGKTTAAQIYKAINVAHESLETNGFARVVERRISQAMMTGSLDSQWEGVTEEAIKPEAFEAPSAAASRAQLADKTVVAPAAVPGTAEIAEVEPAFTTMNYKAALKYFTEKAPIPKSTFAKMSAAMKARSFTVAGLASEQALGVAQAELSRSIVEGSDLKDFGKRLNARFDEAGLSKLNPSHVETVFRTNVLDTYNIGRKAEMSQPATLKARPYWLIRTVQDARQRPAHKVVSNWAIRADDSFWTKVGGPPWGFNCFLPDQQIRGTLVGAARSLYAGKAIELTTVKGRRLTVTANHPVLTAQGLVPAQALREGMQLVGDLLQPGVQDLGFGSQRHENQASARAEDAFGALSNALVVGHSGAGPDDFHGEAQRFVGKIQVVGAYYDLARDAEAARAEHDAELLLEATNSAVLQRRAAFEPGNRSRRPGDRRPGFGALPLDRAAIRLQPPPLREFGFGSTAEFDAVFAQDPAEGLPANANLARELLERCAGQVEADQVLRVREFDFCGHVYDFQSNNGLLLTGVATSNCRCRTLAIREGRAQTLGIRMGAEIRGIPDDGFTPNALIGPSLQDLISP